MAPSRRVEGRHPHQTVDAVLALEKTVGVFTLVHDGGALEPRLVPVEVVHHPDLIAVAVRPHVVHPVQHRRPVLRLGPARAGVEGQDGVVPVIFPRKQGAQARLLHLFLKRGVVGLQLFQQAVVALLDGHLAERHEVVPAAAEPVVVVPLVLQGLQPLLHLLGFLHVVPEPFARTGRFQLLDLPLGRVQLQRPAQQVQVRFDRGQFLFIFFKFQHSFNHFHVLVFSSVTL